jgi:Trypsin-like peptidase domain
MKYLLHIILILIPIATFSQHLNKDSLINYSYIINGKSNTKFQISGTGSIVTYRNKHYLVTNFHVLTAKDANTNQKFPDVPDTNTSISIIFQPIDRKSNFVVMIYRLFDLHNRANFDTFMFQDNIIDISVMPVIIPDNAFKAFFSINDFDTSGSYAPDKNLMIFGYPLGNFKNNWQPTELDTKSISNCEKSAFIFDPFVFFDTQPIKGMSGSPIYMYDSSSHIKVLSIAAGSVVYDKSNSCYDPRIKGRSVNAKWAVYLIKKMYSEHKPSIKGEVYKGK